MKELAKWIWAILIIVFFAGWWIFVIAAAYLIAFLLVMWLKPEWLD